MNMAANQLLAVSSSLRPPQTRHILTHQKRSISRRIVCHPSCLGANKTRKYGGDYGPGCNLKALYLCENKELPATVLQSRPHPPPHPGGPPAPVAAYLRILLRGDHKAGPTTRGATERLRLFKLKVFSLKGVEHVDAVKIERTRSRTFI